MNEPIEIPYSRIKTAICALLLALWIIVMVGLYYVARATRIGDTDRMIRFFHRGVARLFNLTCDYEGELLSSRPTIYVCNHVSYLDVFLLGGILPGSFVAKSEVSGWPVFGKLANFQKTLFIERRAARAAGQVEQLRQHLFNVSNLILFPEGTSTPGTHVARFRSTLFAAAEGDDIDIQPVTVAYTHYRGQRMGQAQRDRYAWYLPMPFLSHFLAGLGLGPARARLIFHEPVKLSQFDSRKACAEHCEKAVRAGLLSAIDAKKEAIPERYLAAVGPN